MLIISSLTHAEDGDVNEGLKQQANTSSAKENIDVLTSCHTESAVDFAQKFYQEHYLFFSEPQFMDDIYTAEFGKVISIHAECGGGKGMCYVNYNLWLSAQGGYFDGEIDCSTRDFDKDTLKLTSLT